MPSPVADLAGLPTDVRDLTFHAESRNVERLVLLRDVDRIWCLNTRAKFLPLIAAVRHPTALYLEALAVSDLLFLQQFETLRVLRLDGATRVVDLEPVGALQGLLGLSLEHFPKVRSLEPLSRLVQLEALDVSGSIWTRMKVDSLQPLSALVSLRGLSLTNIKPSDESLEPLAQLTSLRELRVANLYPVEQMARLSAALPTTACDWFRPFRPLGQSCEACGAELQMPTGKGKKIFCPACNPGRATNLREAWDSARSSTA